MDNNAYLATCSAIAEKLLLIDAANDAGGHRPGPAPKLALIVTSHQHSTTRQALARLRPPPTAAHPIDADPPVKPDCSPTAASAHRRADIDVIHLRGHTLRPIAAAPV